MRECKLSSPQVENNDYTKITSFEKIILSKNNHLITSCLYIITKPLKNNEQSI